MKAVFDSNIFVSAFTLPGGQGEAAIIAAAEGNAALYVSRPTIHEVLDVLSRKFNRNAEELARVAVYIADLATLLRPRARISVLKDEPDNRVLECAIAARADVIVSGDKAMLALGEYKGIQIVTLRRFLELAGADRR